MKINEVQISVSSNNLNKQDMIEIFTDLDKFDAIQTINASNVKKKRKEYEVFG